MNKEYKRFPIQLNSHTIIMIHMFHRHDCLEDLFINNCDHKYEEDMDCQTTAANQLIDQLGDHWTPKFLMELRKKIDKELKKHDEEYNTTFEYE